MDRWQIVIEPVETGKKKAEKGDPPPYNIINNYFSIGVVSFGILFTSKYFTKNNFCPHAPFLIQTQSSVNSQ